MEQRQLDPEGYENSQRAKSLRNKYGIGLEEYHRLLAYQGGACAVCLSKDHKGRGWHVDHDHQCCGRGVKTCGRCVRGLLCHNCNVNLVAGYEAIPKECRDSARLNAYLCMPPFRRMLSD
ncbi:endonuclease domain-containing protein [Streptomyces violascens]|uniref:endonuclease domain-containing protein n=1 Tax=Streptomyces violascens TaxID=67381 RepID=UPI0037B14CDF